MNCVQMSKWSWHIVVAAVVPTLLATSVVGPANVWLDESFVFHLNSKPKENVPKR